METFITCMLCAVCIDKIQCGSRVVLYYVSALYAG